jgi:DNA-binding CsgD family transcriptional regulator
VKKADGDASASARRPARGDRRESEVEPIAALDVEEPESQVDPAYAIVSGILAVVPATRWTFARVEPSGELVTSFGSRTTGEGLEDLNEELKRQRTRVSGGPRIAASLGPLDEFTSGITLLFADARANYGILTLLRTAELGPFTSAEISMLTIALDAVSEHLSALRLQPPPKHADAETAAMRLEAEPSEGAFYVLDSDLQIILAWSSEEQRRIALTGLHTRLAERLPSVLEETVRSLTSAWSPDAMNEPGVARPVSFLVVRTQPMSGPTGLFIGVRVERFHPPNSLTGVATRFHISPREVQVLALLLDGNQLDQIANQLFITSSTVQDHIKSMLDKTESRNRSELIARVLGWEFTPGTA